MMEKFDYMAIRTALTSLGIDPKTVPLNGIYTDGLELVSYTDAGHIVRYTTGDIVRRFKTWAELGVSDIQRDAILAAVGVKNW